MPYGAWPTLGNMIASGKRLVVFIDFVGKDGSTVDYLLPEFGMVRPYPQLSLPESWLTPPRYAPGSCKDMGVAVRHDERELPVLDRQDPRAARRVRPDVPHQPQPGLR